MSFHKQPPSPPSRPRKKLSDKRLASLAKARERASQVAREKREAKAKPKIEAPIVVVEQEESDEDEYEGPPGILFVKRKRAKPKPPDNNDLAYFQMFGPRANVF